MRVLSNEEVSNYLADHLTNWTLAGSAIRRELRFRNFIEAFSFMTTIALEAEKMDHHPEWTNVYNMLNITLSTHTPKGITELDLDLAKKIDIAFENRESP